MDTQSLPLVPFGKYKGQPITTLMNDTKYLDGVSNRNCSKNFQLFITFVLIKQ